VTTADRKRCFVITPIGEPGTAIRERSDEVFEVAIAPAAVECSYDAKRGDQIDKPGYILRQVVREILHADLLIADLTLSNPNVMYELGIAHALGKPLVQIMEEGQELPFDVAQHRTINYKFSPRGINALRAALVRSIRIVEQNPSDVDSPVSDVLVRDQLMRANDPVALSLARLEDRLAVLERRSPRPPNIAGQTTVTAATNSPSAPVSRWCSILTSVVAVELGKNDISSQLGLNGAELDRAIVDLEGLGVLQPSSNGHSYFLNRERAARIAV
jgi:hypothetical protein